MERTAEMFKKVSLFIILVVALLISGCADKSADVVSKVKNDRLSKISSNKILNMESIISI